MIDASVIKDYYKNLSDSQLISLARNEGHQITADAFHILRDEFIKRDLDFSAIENAQEKKVEIINEHERQIIETASAQYMNSITRLAIAEKELNKSDDEIIVILIGKGLDLETAKQVLEGLDNKVQEFLDELNGQMLLGIGFFTGGLFITFVTYSYAANGGTYVIAWGAIIFGAIRFFRALSKKGYYNRVKQIMEYEVSN